MTHYVSPKTEDPFSGWPQLEVLKKGQGVRLKGDYKAPSRWWDEGFGRFVALVSLVALPVSCFMATKDSSDISNGPEAFRFAVLYLIAAFALVAFGSHFGTKKQLDVVVRPDNIRINGRNYRREEGLNEFAIDQHEKAYQEAKIEHDTQKRQSRIYRDAPQVIMRYGEKRVPVASFRRKDLRKAEGLLVRLQMLAQPKGLEQVLAVKAPEPEMAQNEVDDFGPERPIR